MINKMPTDNAAHPSDRGRDRGRAEAREDGTAGTIGSEQSRVGRE